MQCRRIDLSGVGGHGPNAAPVEVFACWPRGVQVAALISSGEHPSHARWSVLGRPSRSITGDLQLVVHGVAGAGAAHDSRTGESQEDLPPFQAGAIGWIGYDAGRVVEPASVWRGPASTNDRDWPLTRWWVIDDAVVYDHLRREWWEVGTPGWYREMHEAERAPDHCADQYLRQAPSCTVGPIIDSESRETYMRTVERAKEYIRAGDVYQVNLAHRMSGPFTGSSRTCFTRLLEAAGPWYGAYTEFGDGDVGEAVASVSPELFLSYDPRTRKLMTRPMKGTRRAAADARDALSGSIKDQAELNMIVDLMRNDLGRVCELGSVKVESSRDIERHARGGAELLQATATVSGTLASQQSVADAILACFPGGSITGAPKVRAMQIIDELELVRRGPYCGAIGFVSRSGHAAMNIAIRTASIRGTRISPAAAEFSTGMIDYSVGAGIVADSNAAEEWSETLDKAGVFLRVAEQCSVGAQPSTDRPARAGGPT